MVVADRADDGSYTVLEDAHSIPRLGDQLLSTGMISDVAVARAKTAMKQFASILHDFKVECVHAVATSAMRDALNGRIIQQQLEDALGFAISIIDGTEEASLTFLGAIGSSSERTMIIDIGGGSTEYAYGCNGIVYAYISAPIGAVRYSETYGQEHPIPTNRLDEMRKTINELVDRSVFQNLNIDRFVGVSGTPVALAMIDQGLTEYSPEKLEGYTMSITRIEEMASWLCSLTMEELRAIPGIHQRRADIVPIGANILAESMNILGVSEITTTIRGLRFGAMLTARLDTD